MSWGSVLVLILFHIFIGNMDSVIKGTLSKFIDNITLCGAVDKVKGRDAIHRNLDRFERWTNKNLMKFNKMMCKVLYLNHGNPRHTHRLDRQVIGNRERCV